MLHSQLGLGIVLLGQLEREGQVVGTEYPVEDTVTPCAVVVDGLVDNVPVTADALVVAHDVGHVGVNDRGQSGTSPRPRSD